MVDMNGCEMLIEVRQKVKQTVLAEVFQIFSLIERRNRIIMTAFAASSI